MTEEPRAAAWAPDWAVPPADTLVEWMADQGVGRAELAGWMCVTPEALDSLLSLEEGVLDEAMAQHLEQATSVPARLWLALEANYRRWLAARRGADVYSTIQAVIDKLIARRHELRMTQQQVGDIADMHQASVATLERRAKGDPRIVTLARYAKAVGMRLVLDVELIADPDASSASTATATESGPMECCSPPETPTPTGLPPESLSVPASAVIPADQDSTAPR